MKVCKFPKKDKSQRKRLALLEALESYLAQNYAFVEKEHRFHTKRLWRFDYALLEEKIAIEIEGGIYKYGRHNRGQGYQKDLHKYNAATKLGWKLFRFSYQDLEKHHYKNFV